jgi:hypothetical protein
VSTPPVGLDPLRSRPWPPGVLAALDRWRQGHVLDGVPLLSLGPVAGVQPLWAAAGVRSIGTGPLVLGEDPMTARSVMVVSQGCDLIKDKFPFATVVPVYDGAGILGEPQQAAARAGRIWHLVHVTADWASGGLWVADLRHEMSIDKSLLVGPDPIEAFPDDIGYALLAERLAAARQRPAMPEPCIEHVVMPLKRYLAAQRDAGVNLLTGVRELRLQSNHPVAPTAVTLFVVADDDQQPNVDGWAAVFDALHEQADAAGVAFAGPDITDLRQMSAADYLTSQAIADADSS